MRVQRPFASNSGSDVVVGRAVPSKKMFRQTAVYRVQRPSAGRRRVRPSILRGASRQFRLVIGVIVAFVVVLSALSYWAHSGKRDKAAAPAAAADRAVPL